MDPVLKNVGERSSNKSYCPINTFMVSNIFKKLENNKLVKHLEKHGLFLVCRRVLGLPRKTANLASDWIAATFSRCGATQAVTPDISKAFNRVWHASLLHKLKPYGISGHIFYLISPFLNNRQFPVVLDGNPS